MPKKEVFRIIPKPKPKTPLWFQVLFSGSLILVALSIGLFFFLENQVSVIQKDKERLEAQITEIENQAQTILAEELFEVSQKIGTFSRLFKERKIVSPLFRFLRAVCHPKVQFVFCRLDIGNYKVELDGRTESFQTLGEQLLVFRNNKDIRNLRLAGISFDKEGKVSFEVTFNLAETIFKSLSKNSRP